MSSIHDAFTRPLLTWYDANGRRQLPWQNPRSPYFVWLSEIMLQQTQVKTVIPYFNRFVQSFPTINCLAAASEDEVLRLWSGLGYYARGRNLHITAKLIVNDYHGVFPQSEAVLVNLPGIGRSTAAAITSQAFNQPTAILDGNVKRVLSRYFLIDGELNQSRTVNQLWELASQCMSQTRCADYTQAIMDFGAMCCRAKRPDCDQCPLQDACQAHRLNQVDKYPYKKPAKKLPEKHRQFLLMIDQHQQIYLEKRPPLGIWGGLWCTPEIDIHESPQQHIEQTYPLHVINLKPLQLIKHTFTHFRLFINALTIETTPALGSTSSLPGLWFSIEETSTLGLAKPMLDLIQTFSNQSS